MSTQYESPTLVMNIKRRFFAAILLDPAHEND